jgi:hypothetical protein
MKLRTDLTVAYSQIYAEDYSCTFHAHEVSWNDEEFRSMLCVGEKFMILGTAQSIHALFDIEILKGKPQIDLTSWDHVNECSIEIGSGLLVSGDCDAEGEMLKIDLPKGIYHAFVCYKGLGTISLNGLEGHDSYHVFMWPSLTHIPMRILKQWTK